MGAFLSGRAVSNYGALDTAYKGTLRVLFQNVLRLKR